MPAEQPTILVVDDDDRLADMYAGWLGDRYRVVTAYGGNQARLLLTDEVDVVLLDRLMPDVSGADVLATISERDLDCRVALVTAVEPDLDVLEMAFDAYLTKPVLEGDLYHVIEQLLTRSRLTDPVRECEVLADKRTLLETNVPTGRLDASEEYRDFLRSQETACEQGGDRQWRETEPDGTVFRRLAHHLWPGLDESETVPESGARGDGDG